ncbi:MAG: cysteine rich repeat-containing protein [Methylocapsa sp.]|nr:cysteine rich repeat-containing protein [Methylocapsa sp.]
MPARFLSAAVIASFILAGPVKSRELEDLRTYCMSDIKRLCPGIEPGGGRIIKCLKANKNEMTVGCAQALQKLKAKRH